MNFKQILKFIKSAFSIYQMSNGRLNFIKHLSLCTYWAGCIFMFFLFHFMREPGRSRISSTDCKNYLKLRVS